MDNGGPYLLGLTQLSVDDGSRSSFLVSSVGAMKWCSCHHFDWVKVVRLNHMECVCISIMIKLHDKPPNGVSVELGLYFSNGD